MKRIISLVVIAAAALVAFSACEKKPVPDGKVGFKSFSFKQANNSALPSDLAVSIDDAAKTLTVTVPTSVTSRSFVPSFTVTEFDEVTSGGAAVTSDQTSINITSPVKVNDPVSGLDITYNFVIVDNDGVAEITSLVFKAADNSLLSDDVAPDAIASDMLVRVPGPAFQQKLKIVATATANDEIRINNTTVASGEAIEVDTSFPIDITVNDAVAGVRNSYVLKVGKILQSFWAEVATFSNAEVTDFVDIAVDGGSVYVAITENDLDGDKVTTRDLASVLKYDGGAFDYIGDRKFSGARTNYGAIEAFDGKVYYSFTDYGAATAQKHSVAVFDGASWGFVGDRGFGPKVTGISNYRTDLIVDPVTKNPILGQTTNEALNGLAKRDLAISVFDGSAWTIGPVPGRTQDYCYNVKFARSADAVYVLAANQNTKTFSLYQYKSGAWSVLVADLAVSGTTDICTVFMDLECDPEGNVWAAVGDNSSGDYLCYLYKFNGTELERFNNPVPNATFNNSADQWSLTFDAGGNPVVAYVSDPAEGASRTVKVVAIDPETLTWGEAYDFGQATSGKYLSAGRAADGTIYVAYPTTDTDKVNTIHLQKFALEDDIIPE